MKRKKTVVTILKYLIVLFIISYTILLFVVTGGSKKPFDMVSKSVEKSVNLEQLQKTSMQNFKRYYGLNASDYNGVMLYISTSSMSAEELLLVQVKSENQVSEVREAIEARKDSRRQDFNGYAPEEVKLLDESILQIRGNYIFFVVSKDAMTYKKSFTGSL